MFPKPGRLNPDDEEVDSDATIDVDGDGKEDAVPEVEAPGPSAFQPVKRKSAFQPVVRKSAFQPVARASAFQPVAGRSAEQPVAGRSAAQERDEWCYQLLTPVPKEMQCIVANCEVAPPGHRIHPVPRIRYDMFELKIIIQYLVHVNKIDYGKGLNVWEEMHKDGYMKHRTVTSLNNRFKKYLLRDIKKFELPAEIEEEFLQLRPSADDDDDSP